MEDAETLQAIADNIEAEEFKKRDSVQKTYVLSRKALSSLDRASKSFNAPRDALVEYSVRRLWPIIENEREKHQKRKALLAKIANHYAEGEKFLVAAEKDLGPDDPVVDKLSTTMAVYRNALAAIDTDAVGVSLEDDLSPGVFKPTGDQRYTCVVMPMRI